HLVPISRPLERSPLRDVYRVGRSREDRHGQNTALLRWNDYRRPDLPIHLEGEDDLRKLPLHLRKTSLQRLLARRPEGIFVNPFERGEIGPELFRAACRMGLEGLVSKHRDRPYQAGRSRYWVKVKNRRHPAMYRVMDALA